MNIKAKIITDGTKTNIIENTHPEFENMTAVFVDAEAEEGKFFSADCAAEITVDDINNVKDYFASYRYSLFLCKPFFG